MNNNIIFPVWVAGSCLPLLVTPTSCISSIGKNKLVSERTTRLEVLGGGAPKFGFAAHTSKESGGKGLGFCGHTPCLSCA